MTVKVWISKPPIKNRKNRIKNKMKYFYENLLNKLKISGIEDAENKLLIIISEAVVKDINTIIKWKINIKNNLTTTSVFDNEEQKKLISDWTERLIEGIPLQYIIGKTDFYGYSFKTSEGVLIPRFDTEILVDKALEHINDGNQILDLCCGTGCIGITLALEKNVKVTLADISDTAIEISKENIAFYKLEDRITVIKHNVKEETFNACYDMIVSNPPYISTNDIKTLSREVQKEPTLALDGGTDGLDFYKIIAAKYKNNIKKGGSLLLECGMGQFTQIMNILRENEYGNIESYLDYNSINRIIFAKKI